MAERVKSWRAWAIVADDRWIAESDSYGILAVSLRRNGLVLLNGREKIVRVTITVDEKKRRKGKVKRG